jgi:type II secretory pathway component PulF
MAVSNLEKKFAKLQFTAKKRNRIYRKLKVYLSAGVPLPTALDTLYAHASNDGKKPSDALAIVIDDWRMQVADGRKLGQAIREWVPDSDRLVIEGGEEAGRLEVAIEKAIMINESAGKIKYTVIQGLGYPVLLVFVALALLVLQAKQVVPAFDSVLPREQWTGLGAQFAFVAMMVDNFLFAGIGLAIGLITLITYTMPKWAGGLRVRFDKWPPWSIYRLVLGSGFMLTISGMIKAGIPLPGALALLGRDAQPWYRLRLRETLQWVEEGKNLGEALHLTGYDFPDRESVMDLRAYASLNKFDETLEQLGKEWLEESVQKIEMQTAMLKNLSFFLLGLTFMWIYGGVFSLQQQITNSLQ